MGLLETILITWFSGGLLVSLLVSARGVAHDVWCRTSGRRDRRPLGGDGGGRPRSAPVHHVGR